MKLNVLTKDEFNKIAEDAHLICFKEKRPAEMNTFDFAMLVTTAEDQPACYATCIEMDKESVYMQHGGAFPSVEKTIGVAKGYALMINYLKSNYKRISTRIKNTNLAMLKLAMSAGFLINGVDCFGTEIFLHLTNELGG